MTWFQSLNPIFVLALAPLLVAMRGRRERSVQNPILTMAWGAAITAAAFAALALVAAASGAGQAHGLWLVGFVALYTWGELHILPTGLALFAGGLGTFWGRSARAASSP